VRGRGAGELARRPWRAQGVGVRGGGGQEGGAERAGFLIGPPSVSWCAHSPTAASVASAPLGVTATGTCGRSQPSGRSIPAGVECVVTVVANDLVRKASTGLSDTTLALSGTHGRLLHQLYKYKIF
jgi:hypothetical protein